MYNSWMTSLKIQKQARNSVLIQADARDRPEVIVIHGRDVVGRMKQPSNRGSTGFEPDPWALLRLSRRAAHICIVTTTCTSQISSIT